MKPFERRIFGLVLTTGFVFLALALASCSPDDASDGQVYPKPAEIRNLCGPVGAAVASTMLNLFGITTFVLFAPLGLVAVRFLRGNEIDQPVLRTIGLGFVLFGLSGLCGLYAESLAAFFDLFPDWFRLPKVGPGGFLGADLAVLLNRYVALVGSSVLLGSFVLGGFVLLGDRTLLRILRCLFALTKPTRSEVDAVAEKDSDEIVETQTAPIVAASEASDESSSDDLPNDVSGPGFFAWLRSRSSASRPNRLGEQADRQGPTEGTEGDDAAIADAAVLRSSESYHLPAPELLVAPEPFDEEQYAETVRRQAQMLEKAFEDFNLEIRVVDIQTGPVISQFELMLSKGLRLNKITNLSDDLAIAMKVPSVRIVAPIPGKNTVGVELPNEHRQMVRMRDVMDLSPEADTKFNIPIFLGKDVSGAPMVIDLTKLPHLLIAGRTGTGKSVCLNSIIVSILMTRSPDQVRMLMIDPKMVELSPYGTIPHLMHPVVTDMRKAEAILGWAVEKMEDRYQLLAAAGVRQLSEYNKLSEQDLRRRMKMLDSSDEEWGAVPKKMPYLVIIADEMADLMMTAAKEVETHIIRLAQKSRAVGIHLVLATQKPTVDVVTGLIKSNLPARIAFGVASRTDSQVVLDKTGAERLLGNGDMLFLQPGTSQVMRGQGTYVSDAEIESIIESIGTDDQDFVEELVALDPDQLDAAPIEVPVSKDEDTKVQRDELYYEAVEFIIQEGRGSLSLLQRRFSIGYGRAARMIDFMAEDGVVGGYNGSQAREVLLTLSDWRRKRSAPKDRVPIRPGVPIRSVDEYFDDECEDEYDYAV